MDKTSLSQKITELANELGIDQIGFAGAEAFEGYRIKNSKRRDPKLTMPEAKSVIVAGIYIGGVTLPIWENELYGRTSRLFLSQYFLSVVKPLEPIADLLISKGFQAQICDDAKADGSIIPLKLAAVRAGFGWQGKHSLLISKKYGTFLALGGILTDAEFERNLEVEPNRCVNCDACQKACPLGALDQAYVLNRGRCLSNILQSEAIPEEAQASIGNSIIDCEICQQACPWNKKHIRTPLETKATQIFQEEMDRWEDFFYLPDLVDISKQEYHNRIGQLRIDIPFRMFKRNVLAALNRAKSINSPEKF